MFVAGRQRVVSRGREPGHSQVSVLMRQKAPAPTPHHEQVVPLSPLSGPAYDFLAAFWFGDVPLHHFQMCHCGEFSVQIVFTVEKPSISFDGQYFRKLSHIHKFRLNLLHVNRLRVSTHLTVLWPSPPQFLPK